MHYYDRLVNAFFVSCLFSDTSFATSDMLLEFSKRRYKLLADLELNGEELVVQRTHVLDLTRLLNRSSVGSLFGTSTDKSSDFMEEISVVTTPDLVEASVEGKSSGGGSFGLFKGSLAEGSNFSSIECAVHEHSTL